MWNLFHSSAFLFHLVSFLPLHPPVPVNHAIVQETKGTRFDYIESLLTKKDPYQIHFTSHVKHIKKREADRNVYISIPELSATLPTYDEAPIDTSKAHYQYFTQHRFSKYISYNDFCQLEKRMSAIIGQYIQDEQRSYIIILDDIFLQPMGIRKYWRFPKEYAVFAKESFADTFVDYVIIEPFQATNFI
jgi:hypothetical protein|tara:strand:- start:388 stop:954 length:567 start_codon:yes stop_codon:yes gene_type:complete